MFLLASLAVWTAVALPETCHDDTADSAVYLQHLRRGDPDPCQVDPNDIDSGNCIVKDACKGCKPENGNTTDLPTNNENGFPQGFLNCTNPAPDGTVCQISGDNFYHFQDSNDYLICDGYQTCNANWNVKNVGAVCCRGEAACYSKAIMYLNNGSDPMNPKGSCTNDLCCDGYQACEQSEFYGVNSLVCRGEQACKDTDFELSGDVFCTSESLIGQSKGSTCGTDGTIFDFYAPPNSDHCIKCIGTDDYVDVCADSKWIFHEDGANVKMNCTSNLQTVCNGGNTVVDMKGANSCVHLVCEAGTPEKACIDMVIKASDPSSTCFCEGDGCGKLKPEAPLTCSGPPMPKPDNWNPCSLTKTCEDPFTCCEGGNGQDCSSCGCGATSSSTSSTIPSTTPSTTSSAETRTTESAPDPSSTTSSAETRTTESAPDPSSTTSSAETRTTESAPDPSRSTTASTTPTTPSTTSSAETRTSESAPDPSRSTTASTTPSTGTSTEATTPGPTTTKKKYSYHRRNRRIRRFHPFRRYGDEYH